MLKNVIKKDSVVASDTLEGALEVLVGNNIIKLVKNELIDSLIMVSDIEGSNAHNVHNLTVGRKIKVADYETEDLVINRTLVVNNTVTATLQGVVCNLYYFSMLCDLYTLIYSNGYIDTTSYLQKLDCIKKGVLNTFNTVKTVDCKQLEEFYDKYLSYIKGIAIDI